jgi:FkbM family methyltransferase
MGITSSIKATLSSIAKQVAPGFYWNRKLTYFRAHFSEVEMNLLPFLCKKDKQTLDIGAAGGVFIANMVPYSKFVIGFEPIPADAAILRDMIKATKINARIESVALSDKSGEATLRMIANDFGRSTIESSNVLDDETGSEKIGIQVPIKKLDDFRFKDIGFIKIDVEGGEMLVLEGAKQTLIQKRPVVLFEHGLGASDYYGAGPEQVFTYFTECGYNISTLKAWLNGEGAFDQKGFEAQFFQKHNYFFIAYPH